MITMARMLPRIRGSEKPMVPFRGIIWCFIAAPFVVWITEEFGIIGLVSGLVFVVLIAPYVFHVISRLIRSLWRRA